MQFYYYLVLILLLNQLGHTQDFDAQEEPLFHAEDIKFPLFTHNNLIVDSTGKRVKLAGGNYGGSHLQRQCVSGLQSRPLRDIAMDIRFKFKMNVIRLIYSLQMIFSNNVVPSQFLKANPSLVGKTTLQIFDFTVKTLTDVGLMVFLNNHISTSKWCCSDTDGNGLWYTKEYPQAKYFQHLQLFARRYKNNERVIGIDLRNQIRKANGTSPTWGNNDLKTDWKRAAQTAGEVVLRQAPHWLIIIGGLNYQLDLTGVQKHPIQLPVKNKLVYSGHLYGFSWSASNYDDFKARLYKTQTHVTTLGVPYLLGEFGNNQKDNYWNWLIAYLKQTSLDWTYWVIDGFQGDPSHDETYGMFNKDFTTVRHPDLLADLISVGPPATALKNYYKYQVFKTIQGYGKKLIELIE